MGCPEAELSLTLVDDAEIHQINREFLQHDYATNVISFSQLEGDCPTGQEDLLGDVIISVETAARDAAEIRMPMESELYFLLAHGMLHLCGYEHVAVDEQQVRAMEAKEDELSHIISSEFPEASA